jgi:hypothetical protein
MAQTYDTFWQQRFAKALEAKIQHLAENVCAGQMQIDEYRSVTGQIRGLQVALEAIDEVNLEIHKAEKGSK